MLRKVSNYCRKNNCYLFTIGKFKAIDSDIYDIRVRFEFNFLQKFKTINHKEYCYIFICLHFH